MSSIIDVTELFGLNRESYSIDPVNEADFVAYNTKYATDTIQKFERALVTGKGPKLVLIHLHGDGKTHIANFVCSRLQQYIKKIFLTSPVMSRASKYAVLHYSIMMELWREGVVADSIEGVWTDSVRRAKTSEARFAKLQEIISDRELATAIWAYKEGKASESELISWLNASKVSSSTLKRLNLPAGLDGLGAARVLTKIATLYRKYEKKILFLFIDNADNITEARVSSREIKEAFRLLADAQDLGLILTINVLPDMPLSVDSVPAPLRSSDVMSRIGLRNYDIDPPHMKEEDLDLLIIEVNKRLTDRDKRPKALEKAKRIYGEDIDESLYPFTKKGYDAFKTRILGWLMKSGGKGLILPRDVFKYIDDCLGQAALMKKNAIDEEVVSAVGEFMGVAVAD